MTQNEEHLALLLIAMANNTQPRISPVMRENLDNLRTLIAPALAQSGLSLEQIVALRKRAADLYGDRCGAPKSTINS